MTVRRVLVVVAMLSLCAVAQRRSYTQGGAIPAGTQVQVRFIDALSSETAKVGDTFSGTLEQPIVVNGRTLYAKGTAVTGQVTKAHRSGRLSDPGELELVLTSISRGSSAWPMNVEPLRLKGESHTKSNITKIGGGAAAGAVIGAIAGGGKGAAIGAGVGAAAGTGVAAATGKKDTKIESEAVLSWVTAAPPAGPYAGTASSSQSAPYYSDRSQRDLRSYDDPRSAAIPTEFSLRDRQSIRSCFTDTSNLPPGLAKRDRLPPGLERQVQRNGTLPPGLQKRVQPLPGVCSARLPRLPVDWARVILGRRVLLLDPAQKIVDLMSLDSDE